MNKKSGTQIVSSLAHFGKAMYDIIRAFLQGGWAAAALQTVKHYWPQILGVAAGLILLPTVIFCCVPMMYFGYESSTDTEIAALTEQAKEVSRYYHNYEQYIDSWVEEIQKWVIADGSQNTEMTGTAQNAESQPEVTYEVTINGGKIQKNWFIALHTVSVGNDLRNITKDDIVSFAGKCVDYKVTMIKENTETEGPVLNHWEQDLPALPDPTITEAPVVRKKLEIRYLTPIEIMAANGYTQTDENWARLIYKTLELERNSAVGVLGSVFPEHQWRDHISSDFGPRTNPYTGFHYGVDIGMPMGTPICAVRDGIILEARFGTEGYGYYIFMEHDEGIHTLYAHCSELLVSAGDAVKQGQVIALVGSTGRSTGPHCHFELRINGKCVDPAPYLP